MLKVYNEIIECKRNGILISHRHFASVMKDEDKVPEPSSVEITWDNVEDIVYNTGLELPFNLWNLKKGRLISFFNGSLFDKNTWDIKEWKTPSIGLTIETYYEEKKYVTLKEILNFNADLAIQYLIERGANPIDLMGK